MGVIGHPACTSLPDVLVIYFHCCGYVHQSTDVHPQSSYLVTKLWNRHAHMHFFSIKTLLCPCAVWGKCPSWHEKLRHETVKAYICNSLFHQYLSSNFSVVAPDLHLQKWKQKKELCVPVIVCIYRKCISNIATRIRPNCLGYKHSWFHQISFIINICVCMHLWTENMYLYDKTAVLLVIRLCLLQNIHLLWKVEVFIDQVNKMGYFYACCPGSIAAPIADF